MADLYFRGENGDPDGNGVWEHPASWAYDRALTQVSQTYPQKGDTAHFTAGNYPSVTTALSLIAADLVFDDNSGGGFVNLASAVIVFGGVVTVGVSGEMYSSSSRLVYSTQSFSQRPIAIGADGLYYPR